MRYPASEKAEIIALVEQSHLPAKRTLDRLGIPRATFYRWYDRYRAGGPEALADHRSEHAKMPLFILYGYDHIWIRCNFFSRKIRWLLELLRQLEEAIIMRSELSVIGAMTLAIWIALPTTAIHAKRLIDGASTEIVSATASKDSAPIRGRGVEIDVFRKPKVPLRDAMFIAERLRDGADVIDISFDGTNGKPTYLVTTIQDKTVWSTIVNALTSAIEGNETSISVHELSAADRNMLLVYDRIDARLSQAVSVAEGQANGNALGGGLSLEDGTLSFVVAVLSGERIQVVVLDPPQKTGEDADIQGKN